MKRAIISFIFMVAGFVIRILSDPIFVIPFVYTAIGILIVVFIVWHILWQQFVKQNTKERWLIFYISSFLVGAFILCPLAVGYYIKAFASRLIF